MLAEHRLWQAAGVGTGATACVRPSPSPPSARPRPTPFLLAGSAAVPEPQTLAPLRALRCRGTMGSGAPRRRIRGSSAVIARHKSTLYKNKQKNSKNNTKKNNNRTQLLGFGVGWVSPRSEAERVNVARRGRRSSRAVRGVIKKASYVRTADSKATYKKKLKNKKLFGKLHVVNVRMAAAVIEYGDNWTSQPVFVTPPGRPRPLAFP